MAYTEQKVVFKTLDVRQQRKVIPEDWTASKVPPTAAWRASQSPPSILILKDFRLLPHLLLIPRALGGAEELQSGLGRAPRGAVLPECAPRGMLPGGRAPRVCSPGACSLSVLPGACSLSVLPGACSQGCAPQVCSWVGSPGAQQTASASAGPGPEALLLPSKLCSAGQATRLSEP